MLLTEKYPGQIVLKPGTWYALIVAGEVVSLHYLEGEVMKQVSELKETFLKREEYSERKRAETVEYRAVVIP